LKEKHVFFSEIVLLATFAGVLFKALAILFFKKNWTKNLIWQSKKVFLAVINPKYLNP
jgi:hypothetical protein